MTAFRKIDMAEATRLTREGRLDEALAVLRGEGLDQATCRRSCPGTEDTSEPNGGRTRPLIDMTPPSRRAAAWTSQFTDPPTAPGAGT
jgi:hypothetical protein